jgi:hypothetical protein
MRSILLAGLVVLGIGVTAGTSGADVAPWPFRSPSTDPARFIKTVPCMAAVPPPNVSRIVVEVKKDATRPTLILPRPMLDRVQARQQTKQDTIGGKPQFNPLLLALALAAGGLCLLRGRMRVAFAAGMLLLAGVTLGVNRTELQAATPPVRPAHPYRVKLGELLLDDVEIIVKPDHDQITLTLPPSVLPRLRRDR